MQNTINKKKLISLAFGVILLFPALTIYRIKEFIDLGAKQNVLESELNTYKLSIWITLVLMAMVAVPYKWNYKDNFFFYWIYIFLFLAFSGFGYYSQQIIIIYGLPTSFRDSYTFGVITASINFLGAAVLIAFLQAGVWWFTKKWHRD